MRDFEACDDGNDSDADACCAIASLRAAAMECCAPTSPRVTLALRLATMATTSTRTPACARARAHAAATGWIGPGEGCDDGNDDPTGACNACQPASCGDGVVEEGERCDDGNEVETDDCLSSCAPASCGDGVVHEGLRAATMGTRLRTTAAPCCVRWRAAAAASAGSISRRKIRALSVMTATRGRRRLLVAVSI